MKFYTAHISQFRFNCSKKHLTINQKVADLFQSLKIRRHSSEDKDITDWSESQQNKTAAKAKNRLKTKNNSSKSLIKSTTS